MKLTVAPGTTLGPFDLLDEDGQWFASAVNREDAERIQAAYADQPDSQPSLEELFSPAVPPQDRLP